MQDQLEQARATAEEEKKRLAEENGRLQAQLEQAKKEALEEAQRTAETAQKELQDQLAEANTAKAEALREKNELQRHLDAARLTYKGSEDTIQKLTSQLDASNTENVRLQGQLGEALNYNEKLNDLNIAANEEFGQLEKVKEAAEKKVRQLKKENAELKGELDAVNTINRSNINTIKGLRTNFNVVNKAKIKAEAAQRTAEDQIAQLTRQKTEAVKAQKTAEEEKNRLTRENGRLRGNLAEANVKKRKAEEEKKRFAEEKDDLTIQLGNKNKEQVL